jgi:hypothetical protein
MKESSKEFRIKMRRIIRLFTYLEMKLKIELIG